MDTSLKLADHLSNLKELYLEGCVRTAPTPPPRAIVWLSLTWLFSLPTFLCKSQPKMKEHNGEGERAVKDQQAALSKHRTTDLGLSTRNALSTGRVTVKNVTYTSPRQPRNKEKHRCPSECQEEKGSCIILFGSTKSKMDIALSKIKALRSLNVSTEGSRNRYLKEQTMSWRVWETLVRTHTYTHTHEALTSLCKL